MKKQFQIIIIFCVVSIFGFFDFAIFAAESVGSDYDVSGYAYSENIGLLSFNSSNTGASINYGVSVDAETGIFSGYAWSENIGWITFNQADLTGCPSGTCETRLDLDTYEVSGWARAYRAIAPEGEYLGGWDGWIKLNGSNYGVTLNTSVGPPYEFEGWAYGGDDSDDTATIGWISFNCSNTGVCETPGYLDYKVLTGISLNKSPVASIACNPLGCEVFYRDILIFENHSTDTDGESDIIKSEWYVKEQGQPDSSYVLKQSCTSAPILCDYTRQLEITAGLYTVALYIQDQEGADSTDYKDFTIKEDIDADFECSSDDIIWESCEGFTIMEGETIYFQDASVPRAGHAINSWAWTMNGNSFGANSPNSSVIALVGDMDIKLDIVDDGGRADTETYTIEGEMIQHSPKYKEISPF
ncbi:MAG: hypothetical protein U9Q16_02400 [Patescibacteria group bacterium]|nr:hypothetical protein [Patescibacteria group bacterium]